VEEDGFVEVSQLLTVAVYALVSRGKVVYIGQSTQPLVRLFQHRLKAGERVCQQKAGKRIERFPFDQIYIMSCTLAEVNQVERRLIAKHQPKYNILHRYEKIDFKSLVMSLAPVVDKSVHPTIGKMERRI
jgi:excinuclease UvrABC nuclease subunit